MNLRRRSATTNCCPKPLLARQKVLAGLSVQVYRTNVPITEGNIGQAEDEFRDLGRELFRQADGRMTSAPTRVTVGGLPGVRFEGTLVNLDGIRVVAWITVAFDGRTEYFWDCEFTPEQTR